MKNDTEERLKILFVDDEPNILRGIRRTFFSMRDEWDISYASGVDEALDTLKDKKFDILVSDMRMPYKSGLELINRVWCKYPGIIRIVLSGQSDKQVILNSTKNSHIFLTKPCSPAMFKEVVHRALRIRDLLKDKELQTLAASIRSIPSMPAIYEEIMTEIKKPNLSLKNLGKIIQKDPGMSAKILQIINSSYFGTTTRVASPSQAVVMLGMDIVKGLVLSVQLFKKFEELGTCTEYLDKIWKHSIRVADNARRIAKFFNLDASEVDYSYIAGLLHDIGKLIFMAELKEKYSEVIKISNEQHRLLTDVEKEMLHASHNKLGGSVLALWGFTNEVIDAIAFHHYPISTNQKSINTLTTLHLADAMDYEIYPETAIGRDCILDTGYLTSVGVTDLESIRELFRGNEEDA